MSKQMQFQTQATQGVFPRCVYDGTLMTPTAVDVALLGYRAEERKRLGGRWALCGDVMPNMFSALRGKRSADIAQRMTGFVSSRGGSYAVLTHQVEGHQHRFLLPTYDLVLKHALLAMANERFAFMLGNDRHDEAFVFLESAIASHHFNKLPGLHHALDSSELEVVVAELPAVVLALSSPEAIMSLLDVSLESLSLSVVMPVHSIRRVRNKCE